MASLKYHILKEYANGVMDEKGKFYPYIALATQADVDGKFGVRYFVRSVSFTASKAGATVAATRSLSLTIQKKTQSVAIVQMPETFAASNDSKAVQINLGVLCDINTPLNLTSAGTDYLMFVYAEVTEMDGEYSG